MRSTVRWMVGILVVVGLSGCSDGGGAGEDPGEGVQAPPAQQATNGWVYGVVSGVDGPLAGAVVDAGVPGASATTGADGTYIIANLDAGSYDLSYAAEFYEPSSTTAEVVPGRGTEVGVGLAEAFIAPGVPARYGRLVTYVDQDDTMHLAVGAGGVQTVSTDKTNDRAYYGYWKINADEGFSAAHWFVNLTWTAPLSAPLNDDLGIRYFRGESLQETEQIEGESSGYHYAELIEEGDHWKRFEIPVDDIPKWGKRTWQIGPYGGGGASEFPITLLVDYHITIDAAILSDEGADALGIA